MIQNITDALLWCEANRRIVILDLATQRYCCLPEDLELVFKELVSGKVVTASEYERLYAILPRPCVPVPALDKLKPRAKVAHPGRDTSELSLTESHFPDILAAVVAQLNSAIALRLAPFSRTVLGLVASRDSTRAGFKRTGSDETAISAFLRAKRILKSNDRCLMHSIAMVNYLAAKGFFPMLVIGVKMSPWGAHAWVQDGDRVLNDTVDHVAAYTPILAI